MQNTNTLIQTCFIRLIFVSLSHLSVEKVNDTQLVCETGPNNQTGGVPIRVLFGKAERTVPHVIFSYLDDPVITDAKPAESFYAYEKS